MVSLKKHEKYVKTPGNSGCKDIFVILFSGEMVKVGIGYIYGEGGGMAERSKTCKMRGSRRKFPGLQ